MTATDGPGPVHRPTPPPPDIRVVPTGPWQPVGVRTYGASIYRVEGPPTVFVKLAPRAWGPDDLRLSPPAEARRLEWLSAHGFPAAEVLDVGADDAWSWLVTAARPGVTVTRAVADGRAGPAVDSFAEVLRAMHELDPDDCPFVAGVDHLTAWARRATAQGLVDTDDLDPAHEGRSAAALLAELEARTAPAQDLVVAHGDATPDNVLVDVRTGVVTGVLDTGRLGVSDRWRDLAVARRNLAEQGPELATRFLDRYGTDPDPVREDYYLLVDEFL